MTDSAPAKPRTPRGVQSIETGGAILMALARAGGPLKLRDLAETLGMAAAQLHPYLVSFRNINMVEQTETGQYQLGPFALHLGLTRLRNQNAYRETIRRVPELAEDLGLMVTISVWGLHGPTIVYLQESEARIHSNVAVGGTFMVTMTATGKAFAAFLPGKMTEPLIRTELEGKEPSLYAIPGVSEETFRREVSAVARQGYSVTRDAPIPGVSAIAAPVFDHTGTVQLVVTVIGPTNFIDLSERGPCLTRLMGFTEALSRDLGHIEGA
ncbi:IclR family transcriptional regulator [Nitratireductor sp. ZSWI3]|uniref:IclR family transcriptional regulator n=1 Tax=Nitratireductor sp. ZSWI3 TaxID=2966359 RepID=UPI00214F73EB|nr:IclR family transcriptional regulator [Nitratireductor sp. ZSWI3]MCR4265452.1 IclR family transcriptional regulator [Nitratireductor sp. ZSWI3]